GFGTYHMGAAYVSAALAYSWHDITTTRTVTVSGTDILQGRYQANGLSGRLESGYRFAMNTFGVTPYAAVQVQWMHLPAYTETAVAGSAQFALAYGAQNPVTT